MKYPDDANGNALQRMEAQGDDLTRPHNIEFTVVFPNQDSADQFARHIGALGYEASIEFSETVDGFPWDVVVVNLMAPSHNEIREFETVIQTAASGFGGRNDGWVCGSELSGER
jgi:Regulator of ribonuclease activity B